jgi:hypothetical protein
MSRYDTRAELSCNNSLSHAKILDFGLAKICAGTSGQLASLPRHFGRQHITPSSQGVGAANEGCVIQFVVKLQF